MNSNIYLSQEDIITLQVQAFKQKDFSAITRKQGKYHAKMEEALNILTDDTTEELLYGGAAGGSKSFTLAYWLIMSSLAYPGTRWFVARETLKSIRLTTLPTMQKVQNELGLSNLYHVNFMDNKVIFKNGSEILLLDCAFQPSDPEYHGFGSLEFTGGAFEEGGGIHWMAYEILKTRCGRQYNTKYNLLPKKLTTANPSHNWTYSEFYVPHKKDRLPEYKKYLQARVTDNPFNTTYQKQLERISDTVTKQRLLEGDWEFDDSKNKLMDYNKLNDIFSNAINPTSSDHRYIIVDVARKGKDKTVIYSWHGWKVVNRIEIAKDTLDNQMLRIEEQRLNLGIPKSQVLIDENGVGGGLVDFGGYKGFISNSAPILQKFATRRSPEAKKLGANYRNLKAQCAFIFAGKVNNNQVLITSIDNPEIRHRIIEDLDSYKIDKIDKDGPLSLESKEKQKESLRRSPDDGDALIMRSYFELRPVTNLTNLLG